MRPQTAQDRAKHAAAERAVQAYVRDGMRLGLGSGTTSHWFLRALAEAVDDGLDVVGVATSLTTRTLAEQLGVPLVDIDEVLRPDLTVDGADEIDDEGDMIKGGGGNLLWERIVADASTRMVAVVDANKVVSTLGAFPLPVEVVPYGWTVTRQAIAHLLDEPGYPAREITLRISGEAPVVTNSGHYLLDVCLGAVGDKARLGASLNRIPGVVENGLFTGIAGGIVVGHPDGHVEIRDVSGPREPRC